MGFLGHIRCLVLPHAVNRRRVRSDKKEYSGYCAYCNARIRREDRDKWVRDWRATFGLPPVEKAPPAPRKKHRSSSKPEGVE